MSKLLSIIFFLCSLTLKGYHPARIFIDPNQKWFLSSEVPFSSIKLKRNQILWQKNIQKYTAGIHLEHRGNKHLHQNKLNTFFHFPINQSCKIGPLISWQHEHYIYTNKNLLGGGLLINLKQNAFNLNLGYQQFTDHSKHLMLLCEIPLGNNQILSSTFEYINHQLLSQIIFQANIVPNCAFFLGIKPNVEILRIGFNLKRARNSYQFSFGFHSSLNPSHQILLQQWEN